MDSFPERERDAKSAGMDDVGESSAVMANADPGTVWLLAIDSSVNTWRRADIHRV